MISSEENIKTKKVSVSLVKNKTKNIEQNVENVSKTVDNKPIFNNDIDLLAKLVWHEARGECMDGQQAVAEVAINRVNHPRFPNKLEAVLFQQGQFMSRAELMSVTANEESYEAVRRAMSSPILPPTYVYFSTTPCNGRNHIKIQHHYFGEV